MVENTNQYIHYGLTDYSECIFRVRARKGDFVSAWSEKIRKEIQLDNLQTPTGLIATTTGSAIRIEWDKLDEETTYEIKINNNIDNNVIYVGNSTNYLHEDVLNNTIYTYSVRSLKNGFVSKWSNEVINSIVGRELLQDVFIPTNLKAYSSIVIYWDEIPGAMGYDIEINGEIFDVGKESMYVHKNLDTGSSHTYRIRAKNDGKVGEWSEYIQKQVGAVDLNISNYIETSYTETTVNIEWESVEGATGYDIEVDGEVIDLGLKLTFEHLNLEPGSNHKYRIRAKRNSITGDWSEFIDINTHLGEIKNITTSNSYNSINLNWDTVEGVTSYEIEVDGQIINVGLENFYTHEGLNSGSTHSYRVRAIKGSVVGEWSYLIEKNTVLNVPDGIILTPKETEIIFQWNNIDSVDGYEIEVEGNIINIENTNQYKHMNLIPEKIYNYKIRTKKGDDYSEWSKELNAKTLAIGVPNNIKTSVSENSILLQWEDIDNITGYEIEVDGEIIDNGLNTIFEHKNLVDGKEHAYRVRAKIGRYRGQWSRVINNLKDDNKDMIKIRTVDDLLKIKENLEGRYILESDIDLSNIDWLPIGDNQNPFKGEFNGNGYSIKNVKINLSETHGVGLFASIENALIKKLEINNIEINGMNNVGALAGSTIGENTIESCAISGEIVINGNYYVGGLIGKSEGDDRIFNSKVKDSANINGTRYIGGLIGLMKKGVVNLSHSDANVIATDDYIGGLIGKVYDVVVKESYSVASVKGDVAVGGLIGASGEIDGASQLVEDCYTVSNVIGKSNYVGGIIGRAYNTTLRNCYAAGAIESVKLQGGLVGELNEGMIINSYYDAVTSGHIPQSENDVARLTSGLKIKSRFKNWDFNNIWDIREGQTYPYLKRIEIPSEVNKGVLIDDVSSGDGTVYNPYKISSKKHLNNMKYEPTGHFQLTKDVDMESHEFEPIGNSKVPFKGTFDGKGFTISNLKINKQTQNSVGMFGEVSGVTIKNINLNNFDIKGKYYIAALIGLSNGDNNITNCNITGTTMITGDYYVGGIIGKVKGSDNIEYCSVEKEVIVLGTKFVGGIVGDINNGHIYKSKSNANLTVKSGTIGGLVGRSYDISIRESYFDGNISSKGSNVGGLIGLAGTSSTSYQLIENSYAIGNIESTSSYVGGLIGKGYKLNINNSYAVCDVRGTSYRGGLIGQQNSVNIINSYFDKDLAKINVPAEQAKTALELTNKETFEGWDFNKIWSLNDGKTYPYLSFNYKEIGEQEEGTILKPYKVETTEDLKKISNDLSACYELIADIDLANEEWIPIGNKAAPFTGEFNGNGYKIKNITVNKEKEKYIGLFGYVSNGSIRNVELENINVKGMDYVGGLIGYVDNNESTIKDCIISGNSTIIGANDYIGGLIGFASNGTNIIACEVVENTIVEGKSDVGGLVGKIHRGLVSNSLSSANITSDEYRIGGLIGTSQYTRIKESYAIGRVQGYKKVGGLVGYSYSSDTTDENITNCYALGEIVGAESYIGTLVGELNGVVRNSYAAGNNGGLVGRVSGGEIKNSYYDAIKSSHIPSRLNDIGELTSAMKKRETYRNWDFINVWGIENNQSYPYLKNMKIPSVIREGLPRNDVSGGMGRKSNPYKISTKDQLNNIKYNPTAHYELIADIDLADEEWIPIGSEKAPFTGAFNGNGYTVKNVRINKETEHYGGFFGYISNATIKNVEVENINVKGLKYLGALVGYVDNNESTIMNVSIKGAGSVLGQDDYVGGLIGYAKDGTSIKSSEVLGNITVEGTSYVGGLVGAISNGSISNGVSEANVKSKRINGGGLVGFAQNSIIKESYATGDVEGRQQVGGLIGYAKGNSSDENTINCYALGNVKGSTSSVGGLVGYLDGVIRNSYSAGNLENSTEKGGLVGYISNGKVENSYYDGVSMGYIPNKVEDSGRLTNAMKTRNNYESWDFANVWSIEENSSYPYLKTMKKPQEVSVGLPENEVEGGQGIESNPYKISTKEQLNNIKYDPSAHYELIADIDLNNEEWVPIGNNKVPFTGVFNGSGYKIKNLLINKESENYKGLFGYISNATIKNVEIENINIKGNGYVGALVGYVNDKESTILGNLVSGNTSISGKDDFVGGLIGYASRANIMTCEVRGNIQVKGNSNIGGLVGKIEKGMITNSLSTARVVSNGSYVGGLVGYSNYTEVKESYATGDVEGKNYIGGLVGYALSGSKTDEKIINSYALGNIISKSTSTSAKLGGLIGYTKNIAIRNCYSTGKIEGKGTKGGLIGYVYNTKINSSYFDSSKSGISKPVEQAKTTSEMYSSTTFSKWDFNNIWDINQGSSYPYLSVLSYPLKLEVKELKHDKTVLKWERIPNIDYYEIEINGNVIKHDSSNIFTHTDVTPSTIQKYRIRAVKGNSKSKWSPELQLIVPLQDVTVKTTATDKVINIQWNKVSQATKYELEINGKEIIELDGTSFVHSNLKPNTFNHYRVRAKSSLLTGNWSEVSSNITWDGNTNLALAIDEWTKDINGECSEQKITLKGNTFKDAYTIQFEMYYNTNEVNIQDSTLKGFDNNLQIPSYLGSYITPGKFGVIVSHKGDISGKDGAFDIFSIKLKLKTNKSKITLKNIKILDSKGQRINVDETVELNLNMLKNYNV